MTVRAAITTVVVVVPARDEEALLGGCLDALGVARELLALQRPGVTVSTVVVLDRCVDLSAEVASRYHWVRIATTAGGNVGAARALGVRQGAEGADPGTTWLANTDADTRVPAHWLTGQLDLADSGADAVVGTVEPDPRDLSPTMLERWWGRHQIRDGHSHIHGANLGVRLSAYLLAGGFAPVSAHEDVALVRRLRQLSLDVRASAGVHAVTSGRLESRAAQGFGDYLRDLQQEAGIDHPQ